MITLCYIKSKHFRYAYISLESIPTPSLTQLTPVGDGDRSPCLVTSRTDEHKRPVRIYAHTPRAVFKIYKILSVFISNKIQEYYNKNMDNQDYYPRQHHVQQFMSLQCTDREYSLLELVCHCLYLPTTLARA